MTENEIASVIVDCAFRIHVDFGPGMLESAYETLLEDALNKRGMAVKRQWPIPLVVDGIKLADGFRADLIVNDKVIVEIKSVEALAPVHPKQLLTYLRVSGLRLGLLVNFGEEFIRNGIKRVANCLPD